MPTANLGIGSGLTSTLGTGTGTANLGTGSGLIANLKDAGAVAPTYGAEYQAVYDTLTTPPSEAIAAAQNTMVEALVAAGIWAKLDVFYMYAQTTNAAGEALKNWKLPGTYDATAYNAPTFTALEGFTGDNFTSYIDCNWNPSVNGVYLTQNSASIGLYSRITALENDVDAGVSDGSEHLFLYTRLSDTNFRAIINAVGNVQKPPSGWTGMFIATRSASNSQQVWYNGGYLGADSDASIGVPNANMFVLAYNNNGTRSGASSKQFSMFFAGSLLSSGEILNLTNYFETYMDSNGKGVIP